MPPKTFKCKQCGNCCLNLSDAFQTSVSDEDVKPEHCRNYPKSRKHAEETGCRGFE